MHSVRTLCCKIHVSLHVLYMYCTYVVRNAVYVLNLLMVIHKYFIRISYTVNECHEGIYPYTVKSLD